MEQYRFTSLLAVFLNFPFTERYLPSFLLSVTVFETAEDTIEYPEPKTKSAVAVVIISNVEFPKLEILPILAPVSSPLVTPLKTAPPKVAPL